MKEDFIGKSFTTPKGGLLTVTEVTKGRFKGDHCRYILECSICSQDEELWPYGSIECYKRNLQKSRVPCGCSRNPKWGKWQHEIRIKRLALEIGYIFLGFKGNYQGNTTEIILCDATGNELIYRTIANFLANGLNIKNRCTKDKISGEKFLKRVRILNQKGYLVEGTQYRADGEDRLWVICPICREDDYSKIGGFPHEFSASYGNLKLGVIPCRCSKAYRWSREEREFLIKRMLCEKGAAFKGWIEDFTNNNSRFLFYCGKGHIRDISLRSFLRGNFCKDCSDKEVINGNGYYPERKHEQDSLYVIMFGEDYIKVGRSFNVDDRLRRFNSYMRSSGFNDKAIKILHILTGEHYKVYNEEQWIHEELRERGFEYNEPDGLWSTELFDTDSLQVINYLLGKSEVLSGF